MFEQNALYSGFADALNLRDVPYIPTDQPVGNHDPGSIHTHLASPRLLYETPEPEIAGTIPVVRLLQGLAAIVGALISALGFYKAWHYAESRLGRRLTEFLKKEEDKLALARAAIRQIRGERSAVKHEQSKLFSNHELRKALKHVRKRRFASAEAILNDTITRTQEREDLARKKTVLHEKQRAMAHLLLGAIADSRKITMRRSSISRPPCKLMSTMWRRLNMSGCSI